jgi:hypothetical protein
MSYKNGEFFFHVLYSDVRQHLVPAVDLAGYGQSAVTLTLVDDAGRLIVVIIEPDIDYHMVRYARNAVTTTFELVFARQLCKKRTVHIVNSCRGRHCDGIQIERGSAVTGNRKSSDIASSEDCFYDSVCS